MICFDYHRNCRGGKLDKLSVLKDKAKPSMNEFGLFFAKGDQIVKYVLLQFLKGYFSLLSCITGADLGGRCRGCTPPPPEMTCGFLIQLVFCQKKLCGLLVLK